MQSLLNPLLACVVPVYYLVCLGLSAGSVQRWYWLTSPQVALASLTLYFLVFTTPICLALAADVCRGTNKKERAVHLRELGGEIRAKGSRCRNCVDFLCGSRRQYRLV